MSPSPAPAPAPMPLHDNKPMPNSSSSEDDEDSVDDVEHEDLTGEYQHQSMANTTSPAPAPMPITNQAMANANDNDYKMDTDEILVQQHAQQQQEEENKNPADDEQAEATTPTTTSATDKHSDNLKAAADLIQTLDTAYAHANAENVTSALDAEEARSAARTAAEIVRRYTTKCHPTPSNNFANNSFTASSPTTSTTREARSPMASSGGATHFSHPTSTENSSNANNTARNLISSSNSRPLRYYAKTADRMAQSHAEDNLALSLELERTKLALESAGIAHDATKNNLAEERNQHTHLQRKLQSLEGHLETQRETLGRSGDALEEELDRAIMRMEAAEDDAQLALDFAKESEENREQMEGMLEQALVEIQSLRDTVHHYEYYYTDPTTGAALMPPVGEEETGEARQKSSMKPEPAAMESTTDESDEDMDNNSKRSVRFSDPISFSNSPMRGANQLNPDATTAVPVENAAPANTVEVATTPTRPAHSLVAAGRKLLQLSHSKSNTTPDNTTPSKSSTTSADKRYTFTPERAAERRQQLREQLKQLDAGIMIRTPTTARSPISKQLQQMSASKANRLTESCKAAIEILQASGKRLGLDGHWFREDTTSGAATGREADEFPLDSLARQYSQSVEVKISRQGNEIGELESLCSFLEDTIATNKGEIQQAGSNESWDAAWTMS